MSEDNGFWLLAAGPAGATALYWALYQFYRNTNKSHGFERETKVDAKPATGAESDVKVDKIEGTQRTRIEGDNVSAYRARVQRIGDESS